MMRNGIFLTIFFLCLLALEIQSASATTCQSGGALFNEADIVWSKHHKAHLYCAGDNEWRYLSQWGLIEGVGLVYVGGVLQFASELQGNTAVFSNLNEIGGAAILAQASGTTSAGIQATGQTYGGYFQAGGPLGTGVHGRSISADGYGVRAENPAGTALYAKGKVVVMDGNVGIGTSEPANKLQVQKDSTDPVYINIINEGGGNAGLWAHVSEPGARALTYFRTVASGGTPHYWHIVSDGADDNKFKIGQTTVFGNPNLTILKNGNVGIGTSEPTEALEVVGSIRASESLRLAGLGAFSDIGGGGNARLWAAQALEFGAGGSGGHALTIKTDGTIDVLDNRITGVADPVDDGDGVNKWYADMLGGRDNCGNGQLLKWDGTSWECANDNMGFVSGSGSGSTMIPDWPDAIMCEFRSVSTPSLAHNIPLYLDAGGDEAPYFIYTRGYFNTASPNQTDSTKPYNIRFNPDGSFQAVINDHTEWNVDCVDESKSIAQLYADGQAFDFVGGGGDGSGGSGGSKICSGQTDPGVGWVQYSGTKAYIDVDTFSCGFTATPVYTASIGGTNGHWSINGESAVYVPTSTGFKIYIQSNDPSATTDIRQLAIDNGYHINWIAMEPGSGGGSGDGGSGSGGASLGMISAFASPSCPDGWAVADGSLLNIEGNEDLFDILGTSYGGNGTTTFALPDLRSRAPIGAGQGPGQDNIAVGQQGGVYQTTLTQQHLPTHVHTIDPPATNTSSAGAHTHSASYGTPNGSGLRFGGSGTAESGTLSAASGGAHTHSVNIPAFNSGSAGNNQPFNIRNPYLGVTWCVALEGASGGGSGGSGGSGEADNLGDHTATQNIKLGNFYLSSDGDDEGIRISATGNVGIGATGPLTRLHVASNEERVIFGQATAASGSAIAGDFQSESTSGIAVRGLATTGTGTTSGIFGQSDSTTGRGVYGWATATTGTTYGGYFQSSSTSGRGIRAAVTAATGSTMAGEFRNSSTSGYGVLAQASATSGSTHGGYFSANNSPAGTGVYADGGTYGGRFISSHSTGVTYGVYSQTNSPDGRALYANASSGGYGLYSNGKVHVQGNLTVSGNTTATAYYQSSDRALKTDIERISDPFAVLDGIEGKRFVWKDSKKPAYGVIAQDVETVMPDAVGENGHGYKTVEYDQLIAPLIEAVKQLKAENEALRRQMKADNDNLRAEIRAITKEAK